MTWDIDTSTLYSKPHIERFLNKYGRYYKQNYVVIKSQRYRSQSKNIEDCKNKLHELLLSVLKPPRQRKATKPSKKDVLKRLESKKRLSEKKRLRRRSYDD